MTVNRVMLVLLLAGVQLSSARWVQLGSGAQVNRVVRQTSSATKVDVSVPGIEVEQVGVDGRTFSRVSIPGAQPGLRPGSPEVPRLSVLLAVPNRCEYEVAWHIVKAETLDIADVYPFQPPQTLNGTEGHFPY